MKYEYMKESEQMLQYFQFPKFLLKLRISQNAKFLYMILYDRARISRKNSWIDKYGNVYLIWYLAVLGVNTPFKFAVFVREGAAPLPGIKGDRDLDRPWGQISQNQSENDKKEKIVQRSQLCDHLVGRRDTMNAESNETLPVSEKYMLTIKEAVAYFNIGIKKLRRIAEDNLGTVAVYCGNRFLIIRPKFEEFILNSSEI